jgi:hypothetical protein
MFWLGRRKRSDSRGPYELGNENNKELRKYLGTSGGASYELDQKDMRSELSSSRSWGDRLEKKPELETKERRVELQS